MNTNTDGVSAMSAEFCEDEKTLLPCPFCGRTRLTVAEFAGGAMRVACGDCGALGPDDKSDRDARDDWNMRWPPIHESDNDER